VSWLGFSIGVFLVTATWASVLGTLVITRAALPRLERSVVMLLRYVYIVFVRRLPTLRRRDITLASLAPTALFVLLAIWLAMFLLAYGLLFWPFVDGGVLQGFLASGSSIFTLGIGGFTEGAATAVSILAAGTGIVVIALFIAYLPTLYGRFNEREAAVIRLSARSDPPPWGPGLLAEQVRYDMLDTLPDVYSRWEELVTQISVSTVHYPLVAWFRGPYATTSWLASLVAALDSAALYQALSPKAAPPECRSFLRVGAVALSRARHPFLRTALDHSFLRTALDPPSQSSETVLSQSAYRAGIEELRRGGFPIERDSEEAWRDFLTLRSSYEWTAYALAELVLAPPAPWFPTTSAFDNLPDSEEHR
jgi:hypothetical protein